MYDPHATLPAEPRIICYRCGAVGPEEGAEYLDGHWYCPNCLEEMGEEDNYE